MKIENIRILILAGDSVVIGIFAALAVYYLTSNYRVAVSLYFAVSLFVFTLFLLLTRMLTLLEKKLKK